MWMNFKINSQFFIISFDVEFLLQNFILRNFYINKKKIKMKTKTEQKVQTFA